VANIDPSGQIADAIAAFFKLVFSLTFPLLLTTLCGLSLVLATFLRMPEFGLWGWLALPVIDYARTNAWAAVAVGVFVLSAIPLAWVAFREREVRISKAILEWMITAAVIAFIIWLRPQWPLEQSVWRLLAYGFLLLAAWACVLEASLSTLALVSFRRATRAPRRQKWRVPHSARGHRAPLPQPHGPGPGFGPSRPSRASEGPETIS
jgi:hypothetical protein